MIYPVTQNPLFRVLDSLGRDFAFHPPAPEPAAAGPRRGQPRSAEERALDMGFNSLSDLQCRLAEVQLGPASRLAALREWSCVDGSKAGLLALIAAQDNAFALPVEPA